MQNGKAIFNTEFPSQDVEYFSQETRSWTLVSRNMPVSSPIWIRARYGLNTAFCRFNRREVKVPLSGLSSHVPSSPTSSCPVSSRLVSSRPVPPHLVSSRTVPSRLDSSRFVSFRLPVCLYTYTESEPESKCHDPLFYCRKRHQRPKWR